MGPIDQFHDTQVVEELYLCDKDTYIIEVGPLPVQKPMIPPLCLIFPNLMEYSTVDSEIFEKIRSIVSLLLYMQPHSPCREYHLFLMLLLYFILWGLLISFWFVFACQTWDKGDCLLQMLDFSCSNRRAWIWPTTYPNHVKLANNSGGSPPFYIMRASLLPHQPP